MMCAIAFVAGILVGAGGLIAVTCLTVAFMEAEEDKILQEDQGNPDIPEKTNDRLRLI